MEKEQRITRELKRIVEKSREQFEYRKKRFDKVDLRFLINEKKKQLESLEKQINTEINEKLKELRKELQLKAAKLSKYSVNDILKQGYTITRKNGKIVRRGIELSRSDVIETMFADMKVKSTVK